jgi:hypothetical protein
MIFFVICLDAEGDSEGFSQPHNKNNDRIIQGMQRINKSCLFMI